MLNVGQGSSWLYLNFAGDWHSDFTISIARKDAAAFAADGLDPPALAGKHVRVRGWLAWRNGHSPRPDRALGGRRRRGERQAAATAKGYRALIPAMP